MHPFSYSYFDGKENKWICDSEALFKTLIEKINETFGVKRFEEGGLTQKETLELLDHFLKFMKEK